MEKIIIMWIVKRWKRPCSTIFDPHNNPMRILTSGLRLWGRWSVKTLSIKTHQQLLTSYRINSHLLRLASKALYDLPQPVTPTLSAIQQPLATQNSWEPQSALCSTHPENGSGAIPSNFYPSPPSCDRWAQCLSETLRDSSSLYL